MTSVTPNSPLSAQATVAGDLRDGATLSGRAGPSEFALGGPEEYGGTASGPNPYGGECIYEGESLSEGECTFESVKSQSRESDKMVTIFRDSEIVKQCYCHFEP